MKGEVGKNARVFLGFGRGGAGRTVEVTSRVIRPGQLVRSQENDPGVPSAAAFSFELAPEDVSTTAGKGPLFDEETVWCEVFWTGSRAKRPPAADKLFYGVLKGSPRSSEGISERAVVLNFVGALAGLWDDGEVELFERERPYVDMKRDVLPVLLSHAILPIRGINIEVPPVETDEPFWSPVGRPPAEVLGIAEDEVDFYEVRGPAWDETRALVYVGFGQFICTFDGTEWSALGKTEYTGRDTTLKNARWRVVYLEYDAEGDRLFGVAETIEDDIRKHEAHVKARFTVEL